MTKKEDVIWAKKGITLSEANDIIWDKKINCLPILTEAGRKVQQVAATMAISDMYLSKEFIEKLLKVNDGEMTTDELI